jgi:hypothetical protein
MRISWSTLTLLFSREMRLTACFRPTIVRWWLISVGMTADTTRPAADDDAYTLVENLAGMGTLVSAPSTLRYLELTYEAFKLAAEPGRRWRLPAGPGR